MLDFYQLSRLFEALRLPIFNCFSFRRAWIPSHSTIDNKILCQNILERCWTSSVNKMNLQTEIINMISAALKIQKLDMLRFRGTIQTDGVGITVLKKDRIESIDILVFKVLLQNLSLTQQALTLNKMERLLVAVLLLTQKDETFCTVYMKIPLLMNHAYIDTPNLVKIEKNKGTLSHL